MHKLKVGLPHTFSGLVFWVGFWGPVISPKTRCLEAYRELKRQRKLVLTESISGMFMCVFSCDVFFLFL